MSRPPFSFIWTAFTHFSRPHFRVLIIAPPEASPASPLTWFLVQYVLMHCPELGPYFTAGLQFAGIQRATIILGARDVARFRTCHFCLIHHLIPSCEAAG